MPRPRGSKNKPKFGLIKLKHLNEALTPEVEIAVLIDGLTPGLRALCSPVDINTGQKIESRSVQTLEITPPATKPERLVIKAINFGKKK